MDYQPGHERFVKYEEWSVWEVKDGLAEVDNGDIATAAQRVARKTWDRTKLLGDQPRNGRPGRVANARERVILGLTSISPYTEKTGIIFIPRVIHPSIRWQDVVEVISQLPKFAMKQVATACVTSNPFSLKEFYIQMAMSDKFPVLCMKDNNVHRSLSPELRDTIEEHIKKVAEDNRIPCSAAMTIAKLVGVNPADVGRVAEELRVKISRCQLGCF